MSSILDNKLLDLENANEFECWYLVKQPTSFATICYLVSFLEEYQRTNNQDVSLQEYINKRVAEINLDKPDLQISKNYRALRVAAFFGLIKIPETGYVSAIITPVFTEIKNRTNGDFEKIELYIDIIKFQIEKMYISSSIDEQYQGVRREFRLYPVMLLYKILLELGMSNYTDYKITMNEYRYLVATTKTYDDFLKTLIEISELRSNPGYNIQFDQYKGKFDNRMIQAIRQLDTLIVDNDSIRIKADSISEVSEKVYLFENSQDFFETENYVDFLGSTNSLFEIDDIEDFEDQSPRVTGGENILFYGVPGSGKSHEIRENYSNDFEKMERIVFHPDYMNTDFLGQILPVIEDNSNATGIDENETTRISYDFKPGPFTRILKKATNDKDNMYYLVIEEINRGNAPAIFGEIFQLLDRMDDGTSDYAITNDVIANEVYGNKEQPIRIPSNLTILATMNTSDQNVFTLDTAFQRRWTMKLIKNDIKSAVHGNMKILDTTVTWKKFNEVINDYILKSGETTMSTEDSRLGAYFIKEDFLRDYSSGDYKESLVVKLCGEYGVGSTNELTVEQKSDFNEKLVREIRKKNNRFSEKILKYLWDDVFQFEREIFNNYNSLEGLLEDFNNNTGQARFGVFNEVIYNELTSIREED